ncbi:hypothetical protein RGQ15_21465 [Paracoccus sp. MBLB3053]|uniref:Phage tail protein n=1 Tax=Paracoccus aurantius TaxID=3073814 RepID=A0ABU2HYK5_9RHOB|nr:hypothetical protein [Paracoccus sp. MBLB3053]MDS9470125.1 hypothetical protein [Paracoccus sp. MBLB3053]
MSETGAFLYDSLPQVYRSRDADQGYPLKSFLNVLGEQGDVLWDEAMRLYDNQFIETCDDWLVPYIGALVGYRPVHDIGAVSQRALVGRWLALIRSKGTAATLEEVARGATGWPARVVEEFRLLSHPQFMNHLRPQVHGALDLRHAQRCEAIGGAFDDAHATVDVGRIPRHEGQRNIANLSIWLWRLQAQEFPRHDAVEIGPRRYAAHPLGLDVQAFNLPLTEADRRSLALRPHLPVPMGRRELGAELADFHPRAFRIWVDGAEIVPPALVICNLEDDGPGWAHAPAVAVAFDPLLGRIATPSASAVPTRVEVMLHTGFPGDIGGGAYGRAAAFASGVADTIASGDDLQAAVDASAQGGVVEISDSATFDGSFAIAADPDALFELRAADGQRPSLRLTAPLEISGGTGSEVTLDGLLIGGAPVVVPAAGNELRRLSLRHVTLVPGLSAAADGAPVSPTEPSLVIEASNVIVEIESSVVGGIRCHPSTVFVARDSAIDACEPSNVAIAGLDHLSPAGQVTLEEVTVIGKLAVHAFTLVSNSILIARLAPADSWTLAVEAEDTQRGCARFSWIPPGSRVPRRYRCQPSLALGEAIRAAEEANPLLTDPERAAIRTRILARIVPGFVQRQWPRPAYLQLLTSSPTAIRTGADDEGEMGVWHHIHQPQRESNLSTRLEEFVPNGLEASFFYAT